MSNRSWADTVRAMPPVAQWLLGLLAGLVVDIALALLIYLVGARLGGVPSAMPGTVVVLATDMVAILWLHRMGLHYVAVGVISLAIVAPILAIGACLIIIASMRGGLG